MHLQEQIRRTKEQIEVLQKKLDVLEEQQFNCLNFRCVKNKCDNCRLIIQDVRK